MSPTADWLDTRRGLIAGGIGMTAVAGSYLVSGWTWRFVAYPIDRWIVDFTPAAIVTYMIENVGDEAHILHVGLAIVLCVLLFGALARAGMWFANTRDRPLLGGLLAGVAAWVVTSALLGTPLLALGPAVPVAVFTVGTALHVPTGFDYSRRETLGTLAAAGAFAGGAVGLATLAGGEEEREDLSDSASAQARLDDAADRALEVASEDLPGLVSETGRFYNVDIAKFDPDVSAEAWTLTFTGEVATERTITYQELLDRAVEDRFVTLRCVGDRLNAEKTDNALWTGTPIAPLLEEVDPEGTCNCAMLHGADDYFVQYPVSVLENGFLAWGMNGKELPRDHGHHVRILIPGHWGETNVKWLTEIELLEVEEDGYWEQRGWEGTGVVETVAKLWDEGITELSDGRVELAGHAYAGTRGVDRVEVSVDGGSSWSDAELSDPLPDEDVWRQWRYTFSPEGSHELVVRAIDGEGTVQPSEESGPVPSGATGWVGRTYEA